MTIAAIVQARMSSIRFPGKMLHCVHGRPLLEYVLDRVRRSREIDQAIVATSAEASDEPIADYCRQHGIDCFKGSLKDVASRFGEASDAYRLEAFVRVCGDRPLLDPALLDRGVQMFRETEADLVTNCFPRTFPAGQTVEVVRVSTFRQARTRMTSTAHLEHVTAVFYEYAREYRIHNFTNSAGNQSNIDLSVNTPREMMLFERLVERSEDASDLATVLERYDAIVGESLTEER